MFYVNLSPLLLLRLLALLAVQISCVPCSFCYPSLATVKHLKKVSIMFAFLLCYLLLISVLWSSVLTDGELVCSYRVIV